jgi:DNA-binding NarL/FixJ family response regulator
MVTIPAKANASNSQVRVLVVDDHEQFHQFVRSALGKMPELKIVGKAFDGLDAVHKAEDLRPDLVLLDIGLPGLNGLDAARRIRTLCPESRILFLSQESSIQVVEAALSLGARGYLIKDDAGDDLLEAIGAVIQGNKFVSPGLLSSGEAPV